MSLTTSLAGRVRNTSLPKSHALLPLLEAVVNGLQSIDEQFGQDLDRGRLTVTIERSGQEELEFESTESGRAALRPITGFTVQDNGVGFNTANMRSFETLDSEFHADIGCRGVGRLLWLKAFDRISVWSGYHDDSGDLQTRYFKFSVNREVEHTKSPEKFTDTGAIVRLDSFKEAFQTNAPKSGEAIAREVLEHCIWYFLRPGGAPEVIVVDSETISLNKLLGEFVFSELPQTTIEVNGESFDMANIRLRSSARSHAPRLCWCADNRVVIEENLTGKVPGLYGRLKDDSDNEFTYACYLSSAFLDSHVRSDRTAFDIKERSSEGSFEDDISLDEIRSGVLKQIEQLLSDSLAAARDEGKTRVSDFVSRRAPRYRPVLARMESLGLTVDPSVKDADLELQLHRSLQALESEVLREGQAVFAEAGSSPPEGYQDRLNEYLDKIADINQSDLAAYVSRRRTILDLLEKLIRSDGQGAYSREAAIHSLLFPMRSDSNEVGPDASNLWILDERLAFHEYLASDKTLNSMPITDSNSTKEPDLLATRLINEPVLTAEGETLPLTSIVVVEIKRPMRNDATEGRDPISQTIDYVKRVRSGGVKTLSGRPIPASPDPPAFCYIVADLTTTMVDRCELANLRRTHDGMGYFGFNEASKSYIEVVSFDRLVVSATERNRAFFDKLGLPSS